MKSLIDPQTLPFAWFRFQQQQLIDTNQSARDLLDSNSNLLNLIHGALSASHAVIWVSGTKHKLFITQTADALDCHLCPMTEMSYQNGKIERELSQILEKPGQHALLLIEALYVDEIVSAFGGHTIELLSQHIEKRISECLPNGYKIMALDQKRFLVMCEGIQFNADAENLAQVLLDNLVEPLLVEQNVFDIAYNIGIALSNAGILPHRWLERAQVALRNTKKHSINAYQFYQKSLGSVSSAEHRLIQDLVSALGQDELRLFYQPQVSISEQKIVGLEALVRWAHPKHGLLSPGRFTRLAEISGLIHRVSEWVLTQVCQDMRRWTEAGYQDLKIAVNFSALDITSQHWYRMLKQLLEQFKIEPHRLEIEIVETVLMDNISKAIPILNQLRQDGIVIAIDDFGTGYSSLSYLQNMPVNKIKIDQHFLTLLNGKDANPTILQSIIQLGHKLGLEVLAEGVENHRTLEQLKALGCDLVQGYYFAEPMQTSKVDILLKDGFSFQGKTGL